ncbi:MAG: murein biosynthesis integral membrane protein MurJ [Actinomycetaceae bacterium]|nr:murein biosynthesis integral membrane protein MurJ [Actinomycetaceae bacterium]
MLFGPPAPLRGRHFREQGLAVSSPTRTETANRSPQHSAAPRAAASETAQTQPRRSSAARSSLVMFLGTLVSRILGLVRSPLMLGAVLTMTSPAANAFDVANKLPNLIYMVVVGGLVNAVLVPAIVRATKESSDGGAAFLNKLLTIAIVFLGGVTLLLTLAAPLVVKLFAATMSHDWYRLTVAFAYWCLPQIFFYGMYTVIGQILNARENFGPYMWAPALNNVVAIAGFAVILAVFGGATPADAQDVTRWSAERVAMLGGFSTLGIAAQALILLWPMHRIGIRYRPDFAWRGSGLGTAGRASWWMLLMMITGMVPTIIVSNVAAGASERAASSGMDLLTVAGNYAYTTAYTIYSIPTSLIVVSIATAMFTRLARSAVSGDMDTMRADTSKTLRMVGTLTFLSAAGMIVLAVPLARLLAFTVTPQEAVTLARVVIAMCLGLVSIGAVTVLDRVYYAFEDTRGAFWINLPFQVLGMIGFGLCGLLPPQWTVVGIGLVMAATNTMAFGAMMHVLSGRMGGMDDRRVWSSYGKLLVITVITMTAGYLVLRAFGPVFAPLGVLGAGARIVVVAPIMVAVYFGLMRLLRMDELASLVGPARALLRKIGVRK